MKHSILLIFLAFSVGNCLGQTDNKLSFPLSEFKFDSIFGSKLDDKKSVYCLLGSGFFRAPRASNADSLLSSWLLSHPKAVVLPVSSYGPVDSENPNSKMYFCLVVDGKDSLNNYLIRSGCYPGGTMMRPRFWNEMTKQEQELYKNTNEKPDGQVYLNKRKYDNFIEQIKVAERFAQDNKLGIWRRRPENEED